MKKLLFAVAVMAIALTSCGPTQVVVEARPAPPPPQSPPPSPPDPEVTYQTFYDDLSPYGEWIDYPGYGYVWKPDVGPDFKPYSTNGHWVYSDAGWVWASDYNWGWATFHYGRWFFQDGYGWMWIPGYEWSPAWVSWRRSPDYYGWAPLGPNISVGVSFGGGYNPPAHYWNFVPQQYVTSPHINNYYVNETKNVTIINNTTIINNNVTNTTNNNVTNNNVTNNNITNNHNNTVNNITINRNNYAGGPDPREVETATGAPLRPVTLRTSNRPGEQSNNGQLSLFHPRVNTASPSGAAGVNRAPGTPSSGAGAPAPSRVQSFRDLRPSPNLARPATGANNSVPPTNNVPTVNSNPPVNTVPAGNTHPAGGNSNGNRSSNGNTTRNSNVNVPANNAPAPSNTIPANHLQPVNNNNGNPVGTVGNNQRPATPIPNPHPANNASHSGTGTGSNSGTGTTIPANNHLQPVNSNRPGTVSPNGPPQQWKPQTQQQQGKPRNDTTRQLPKKLPANP